MEITFTHDSLIQFKPKIMQHDGVAFADGNFEPTADFPFEEIFHRLDTPRTERGDPLTAELERDGKNYVRAADALHETLKFVWSDGCNNLTSMRTAFHKFLAMSAVMRPEILHDLTYKELAENCGITRAALSKSALNFSDRFGIKMPRSRSKIARANMRAARLRNFQK